MFCELHFLFCIRKSGLQPWLIVHSHGLASRWENLLLHTYLIFFKFIFFTFFCNNFFFYWIFFRHTKDFLSLPDDCCLSWRWLNKQSLTGCIQYIIHSNIISTLANLFVIRHHAYRCRLFAISITCKVIGVVERYSLKLKQSKLCEI